MDERQSKINELCDMMGLSQDLSSALLLKHNWQVQRVLDAFSDDLIPRLFEFKLGQPKQPRPDLCESCYEEYFEDEEWCCMDDCGHWMCKDCFTGYLISQVNKGPDSVETLCPAGCKLIVPHSMFKKLLDPKLLKKYEGFIG